jgi:hypothetical protein
LREGDLARANIAAPVISAKKFARRAKIARRAAVGEGVFQISR